MKKSLLALAALSAFATAAQAQSSVTVYGILGTAYTDVDTKFTSDADSVTVSTMNTGAAGQQAGSRLGFRGVEDLGGGLKAGFTYELNASLDTGLAANRLGFLDLSGSFGTVRAGKVDSLTRTLYNTYSSHGNTIFAPGNLGGSIGAFTGSIFALSNSATTTAAHVGAAVQNGCTAAQLSAADKASCATDSSNAGYGGTRVNNSIGYISPTMSGFAVQAQYGKSVTDLSVTTSETSNEAMNFGVSYNAGKLSAMLARDNVEVGAENSTTTTEITTDMFGASYDFGVAKAFALYMDKDIETTGSDKTTIKDATLGVSVPVGSKVVLVASYTADGEVKTGSSKTDLDAMQLQANYLFSKRTKAYAMYGETEAKVDSAKYKIDGFTVGLQHSF
jgi:predicted porin